MARFGVLGIGNILWGDEAFGVRAVEAFHAAYEPSEEIWVLDGGTQGLYLVPQVREVEGLIVFDAVDYGLAPGTMKLVRGEEVPKFTAAKKMSLHQTGFQEVLSAAELMGGGPSQLLLIGVQPLDLEDWGGPLTRPVADQIEPAILAAERELFGWGAPLSRRSAAAGSRAALLGHGLDHARYERREEA